LDFITLVSPGVPCWAQSHVRSSMIMHAHDLFYPRGKVENGKT
jgi:hypothetical protein